MLTKFETKSARVKGLSFHPKKSWILVALHNGQVHLWDYRVGALLEKFEDHEGPVRGVCFHMKQPLFVTGGDDYKVKVWNYNTRKCTFTLLGHLDYVRTTVFHHEYPWIVSASDDQTMRIWNWQSRTCVCVVTGHNHYVMSATFHPTEDLLLSASLDQTVRVWDVSGLRKKNVAPNSSVLEEYPGGQDTTNLFGVPNVVVKHVLEGHERGVNWACFHPTLPLIASAADDKMVKLWRMNESKAWEVDTCRGHYGNVSCVVFHSKQELMVSNSEDKSVRVWDLCRRHCVQTFRRDHERHWALVGHPTSNLFATGHDAGTVVFKLERERPAYVVHSDALYYVKDRHLRKVDFATSKDAPLMSLRSGVKARAHSISYNSAETALLVNVRLSHVEHNIYELYVAKGKDRGEGGDEVEYKRGFGWTAVWVARNRFAVLEKNSQILIKNLSNETTKKINASACQEILQATVGTLLLREKDQLTLMDVQQRRTLAQLKVPCCKYAYWSKDFTYVALLSKHHVTLCDKRLDHLVTIRESSSRVKSGAWVGGDVFVYTTGDHVKFVLRNGDFGTVRTLEVPVYVVHVKGDELYCLDRECKARIVSVDSTEYRFKAALQKGEYGNAVDLVRRSRLVGQAFVGYLERKGLADLALEFVKEDQCTFALAVEHGNVKVALEAAKKLNRVECWERLAEVALMQGYHQVVEVCYQRTKSFSRLLFLYLITGNLDKLAKMVKIAEIRGDLSSEYQGALLLGDVAGRIELLNKAELHELAEITAKTHGFDDNGEVCDSKFLRPPPPVQQVTSNWPLLTVSPGIVCCNLAEDAGTAEGWYDAEDEETDPQDEPGWDCEEIILPPIDNTPSITLPPQLPFNLPQNPRELVQLGFFTRSSHQLHLHFAAANFAHYKSPYLALYSASRAFLSGHFISVTPKLHLDLHPCYNLTTSGKFLEASLLFQEVLAKATLHPRATKRQLAEVKSTIRACREYILGLKMELLRKSSADTPRQCELAAYFTNCDLQPLHKMLTLRTALHFCYKNGYYKTASIFAKRLIDLGATGEVLRQTKRLLEVCMESPEDKTELRYDQYNPFVICGYSYKPLYRGRSVVECGLCGASYATAFKGYLCNVCEIAEIGVECAGLQIEH